MSDPAAGPPPLYHGTRAGFGRGGLVLPVALHGRRPRSGHTGDDSTAYAYATPDREMAAFYALNDRHGRGRPRVLTVTPLGPVEADPSRYDEEEGQVRSRDGFLVVAVEILDPADYVVRPP